MNQPLWCRDATRSTAAAPATRPEAALEWPTLSAARGRLRGLAARSAVCRGVGTVRRHRRAGGRRVLVHEPAARAAARPSDAQPRRQPAAGPGAAGSLVPYDLYREDASGPPPRRSADAARASTRRATTSPPPTTRGCRAAATAVDRATHRGRPDAARSGHGDRADLARHRAQAVARRLHADPHVGAAPVAARAACSGRWTAMPASARCSTCSAVGYPALGLAMLRSFYEHRPASRAGTPRGRQRGRLVLAAALPEQQLPRGAPRVAGAALVLHPQRTTGPTGHGVLQRNGGFLVDGYGALFRRHAFRPVDSPVHPPPHP